MRGYTAPAPGRLRTLLRSSVGGKLVMAGTGLAMLGFLVAHLSGNLLVFRGTEAVNAYAAWLREHPALLWGARLVLLAALVAHVATGIRLARENRAARPVRYITEHTLQADPASRTMVLTGLAILAYVAYHLAHLTFHWIDTGGMGRFDAEGRPDVHAMLVTGFRSAAVSVSYLAAQVVLGFHLWHALGNAGQTFGLPARWLVLAGRGLAVAIVLGYVSIPLAIWMGVVS